jgi:hypothetical protein
MPALGRLIMELLLLKTIEEIIFQKGYLNIGF